MRVSYYPASFRCLQRLEIDNDAHANDMHKDPRSSLNILQRKLPFAVVLRESPQLLHHSMLIFIKPSFVSLMP